MTRTPLHRGRWPVDLSAEAHGPPRQPWTVRIGDRLYRRGGASEPVSAAAKPATGPARTITALVLGDPPPGRSALDQKRGR